MTNKNLLLIQQENSEGDRKVSILCCLFIKRRFMIFSLGMSDPQPSSSAFESIQILISAVSTGYGIDGNSMHH